MTWASLDAPKKFHKHFDLLIEISKLQQSKKHDDIRHVRYVPARLEFGEANNWQRFAVSMY